MPDQILDDDDLDLSPEVMCQLARRRSRLAAMKDAAGTPPAEHGRTERSRDR
ncbi:hypothetical protein [Pseudactinotalea terrae]|jgi:hypothetical protein|uniref:hypothetical protein n=1 Tax=Pseudactinotalea terrae TaxID=1743262 RepID=UPI0012E29077|nr:hypothetical protein [Pseudactinotalea terrae]